MPWEHPCFAESDVYIKFENGKRLIKRRHQNTIGHLGDKINKIYVYIYISSGISMKLNDKNICDIFAEYYNISEDIVQIYFMKKGNNGIIDDKGSEHDLMI